MEQPLIQKRCHGLLHSVRAGQGIEGLCAEIGEGEYLGERGGLRSVRLFLKGKENILILRRSL